MRNENHNPGLSSGYILDVINGGTGADSRAGALEYLDAIPREKIGVNQGIVGFLPNTRLIPESMVPSSVGVTSTVNLEGPTEAALLETIDIIITNFDSFTFYDITAVDCTFIRAGELIQVTMDTAVPEAKITVNGSVYPIRLKTVSQVLPNTLELLVPTTDILAKNMKASTSGEYIVVSDSDRTTTGVLGSGVVGLFKRAGETISKIGLFDHSSLDVAISYQGKGSKKINTISTNADGTQHLAGVTPIHIEALGDTEVLDAVTEKGNPSYLEGLPPYQPAVFRYVGTGTAMDTNASSTTHNTVFTLRVEATGWDGSGTLINPQLYINHGGEEGLAMVALVDFSPVEGADAFWTGEIENLPAGYLSPNLKLSITLGKQQVAAQVGLPGYPAGLPIYVPATPGRTVTHDIIVSSNYLGTIAANVIDVTIEPFLQIQLGKSLAVSDTGNIAYSAAGRNAGDTRRSPRVIFQLYSGTAHQAQEICPNDLGALSTFGDHIAISPDGSVLFISDAAYDSVYMYSLNALTGKMEMQRTLRGSAGTGFGTYLSMAPQQNVLAVGIPLSGNQGSIKLYGFDTTTTTLLSELKPTGPLNGNNIAYMFKVANSQLVFASNNQAGAVRRVVVYRRTNGIWGTEVSLASQNAGGYTEFAQSLACNAKGTILSIGYPGSASERGSIESWMRFNGVWTYITTKMAGEGAIGDGFGRHVNLSADASSLMAVRTDGSVVSVFI